jgi:hypothetical protein
MHACTLKRGIGVCGFARNHWFQAGRLVCNCKWLQEVSRFLVGDGFMTLVLPLSTALQYGSGATPPLDAEGPADPHTALITAAAG